MSKKFTPEELAAEVGREHGQLTVLEHLGTQPGKGNVYRCQCSCGRFRIVPLSELRKTARACIACAKDKSKAYFKRIMQSPVGSEQIAPRARRMRGTTFSIGLVESKR